MSLSSGDLEVLLCSPCRLRALTDAELMDALRCGCNDALATLFERHSALVFQIARGSLCSDGEAGQLSGGSSEMFFKPRTSSIPTATDSQLGCSNRRSPVRGDPLHEKSMH
jgi:hypothetical protein